MENQQTIIDLGGDHKYLLQWEDFDTDIDVDDLIRLDYHNLVGEAITTPMILNRVGIIKSEMEHSAKLAKLDVNILEGQLSEHYRKTLVTVTGEKRKLPSNPQVEQAVLKDKAFINAQKRLFLLEKNVSILDSVYWSVKSKDKKIDSIIHKITPKEFESRLVEGKVNSVLITKFQKLGT